MGDITFSDRLVENTADGAAIRVTTAGGGTATEVEITGPLDGDGAVLVGGAVSITDGTDTAAVMGPGTAPAGPDPALNVTISPNSASFLIASPVIGPLTDAELRASAVPVSGTVTANAGSGTFAVSGPLTDTQLRATPVPVSGTVAVSNFPATQPVSGTVAATQSGTWTVQPGNTANTTAWKVDGSAVTQPVSGPLTDAQLRAVPVPVSGTVAATQSGTWTVQPGNTANTTAWKVDGSAVTQPVSGPLTDTQLRATPVPVSGTVTATGPLTDTQLRATPVPVSGTVTATGPLTDTQLRAAPVPVSGTVAATQSATWTVQPGNTANTTAWKVDGSAVTQPVSGTVAATQSATWTVQPGNTANTTAWKVDGSAVTQPVSGTVTANIGTAGTLALNATLTGGTQTSRVTDGTNTAVVLGSGASPAGTDSALNVTISPNSSSFLISSPISGSVSLGTSSGKAITMKTGSATTTATTADQVILTYTTTAGKTFYLEYFDLVARLTTFATTATFFGTFSLESAAGTKLYTSGFFAAGAAAPYLVVLAEPIPIAASTVIRLVCTPNAATSFTWYGNFGGYEK